MSWCLYFDLFSRNIIFPAYKCQIIMLYDDSSFFLGRALVELYASDEFEI